MRNYLPAILNGLAAVGVLLLSFLVNLRLPIPASRAKLLGMLTLYAGMALVIWAAVHIKGAMSGMVQPVHDRLVKEGPYRYVRHPVYLGMTIALVGATVALRSWLGFMGVFVLFLPSVLYRARKEERALAHKFGGAWEAYVRQTGFLLPWSRR